MTRTEAIVAENTVRSGFNAQAKQLGFAIDQSEDATVFVKRRNGAERSVSVNWTRTGMVDAVVRLNGVKMGSVPIKTPAALTRWMLRVS